MTRKAPWVSAGPRLHALADLLGHELQHQAGDLRGADVEHGDDAAPQRRLAPRPHRPLHLVELSPHASSPAVAGLSAARAPRSRARSAAASAAADRACRRRSRSRVEQLLGRVQRHHPPAAPRPARPPAAAPPGRGRARGPSAARRRAPARAPARPPARVSASSASASGTCASAPSPAISGRSGRRSRLSTSATRTPFWSRSSSPCVRAPDHHRHPLDGADLEHAARPAPAPAPARTASRLSTRSRTASTSSSRLEAGSRTKAATRISSARSRLTSGTAISVMVNCGRSTIASRAASTSADDLPAQVVLRHHRPGREHAREHRHAEVGRPPEAAAAATAGSAGSAAATAPGRGAGRSSPGARGVLHHPAHQRAEGHAAMRRLLRRQRGRASSPAGCWSRG